MAASGFVSFGGVQIPLCHFTTDNKELLGNGGFGHVYKRHCKETNCWVAVKEMEMQLSEESRDNPSLAIREAQTLFKIKHENIVQLYGCEEVAAAEKTYNLVMEYLPNGSLFGFLQDDRHKDSIPWTLCWRILLNVANGMAYLHAIEPKAVIHCDLKADNVLLTTDLKAKIADFGLAVWKHLKTPLSSKQPVPHPGRCTITHCAPEWLMDIHTRRRTSLDVYSFGILMWEVITKKEVYENVRHNTPLLIHGVQDGQRPSEKEIPAEKEVAPLFRLHDVMVPLMKRCWDHSPEERPSFEDILGILPLIWTEMEEERPGSADLEIAKFVKDDYFLPEEDPEKANGACDHSVVSAAAEQGSGPDSWEGGDILYFPRSAWRARDAKGPTDEITAPYTYVIVCHTVSCGNMATTTKENKQRIYDIQEYHFKQFSDIGYNFLIGGDGNVYEGRGFDVQGAHTYRWNKKALGIAFIGRFNAAQDKPTIKMLRALEYVITYAIQQGKLIKEYTLLGHAQARGGFKSPGKNVFVEIQKMPHWKPGLWHPKDDSGPDDPTTPPDCFI